MEVRTLDTFDFKISSIELLTNDERLRVTKKLHLTQLNHNAVINLYAKELLRHVKWYIGNVFHTKYDSHYKIIDNIDDFFARNLNIIPILDQYILFMIKFRFYKSLMHVAYPHFSFK